MNHVYNLKKGSLDQRDYRMAFDRVSIPTDADLYQAMPAPRDQADLGCCGGFGGCELYLGERSLAKRPVSLRSPLELYYLVREMEGTVEEDAGVEMRDVMKVLTKQGVCAESKWRYVPTNFDHHPSAAALKDGLNNRIKSYHSILSLRELKVAVATGHPVALGMLVYESFESDRLAETGIMPMPKNSEQILGGHFVVAYAYNDAGRYVEILNSWGSEWGLPKRPGCFRMPYAYFDEPDNCEMWHALL